MGKDVVLVYPKPGIDFSPSLPFPLLFPASTLIENGFSVKIIDERVLEKKEFIKILRKQVRDNPICIGISTMTGPQIKHALGTAEIIREENLDLPLVWGGVHPSLLPDQTLQDERVDIVVRREGEETMLELVQKLEKNKKIDLVKGISFKNNGRIKHNPDRDFIKLDKLPPLPYDLINLKKYVQKTVMGKSIQMYTSRGCPHNCKFCYNYFYHNSIWRFWSPKRVMDELNIILNKLNINGIFFLDDNFFTSFKRVEEIVAMIKREKIDINWSADCRVDYFLRMSNEFLDKVIDGGLTKLYIGAEAGSERVLKLINKGITPQQIIEANKRLAKFDIIPEISFIIGFPTETLNEIHKTMDVIDRIIQDNKKAIIALVKCYTPFPGSQLFDLSVKYGFRPPESLEEWSTFSYYDLHLPWLKDKRQEIENISLISRFVTKMFIQYGINDILMRIYSPLARFRWKHRIFKSFLDTLLLNHTKQRMFAT